MTATREEQTMSGHAFESEVLLRSSESDDAIAIIELAVGPEWDGPPLHHHQFDEAFYVLEGTLTFQLGDELITAEPGSLTFAPRGSHHTLANLTSQPARYVLICTPGGFERRFDRRNAEEAGRSPSQEALKPLPEVTVVGPQIRERLAARS
jgi:mannose-6-phosphate isomerase-like protein (cupin superfamily)